MTPRPEERLPRVLCSRGERWGRAVMAAGWDVLSRGGGALDAVERATNVVELDPEDSTVGYGGLPNAEGVVELDASIMVGPAHDFGAVAALRGVRTPSSVARRVMEAGGRLMLAGEGARRFATAHGFAEEDLLTDDSRARWRAWRDGRADGDEWVPPQDGKYEERGGRSHGTINVLAIDAGGTIAGVTSTSGISFKTPGRVGDSPLIGAGLYLDNDVGAAGATGHGEEVIRACGAFFIVERMREGMTPREACEAACRRIIDINGGGASVLERRINDKFVALGRGGEVGCAALRGDPADPPRLSYRDETGFHVVAGSILIEG